MAQEQKGQLELFPFEKAKGSPKAEFQEAVEEATRSLLGAIQAHTGINIRGANFIDTPARVARAYAEILDGLFDGKRKLEEILSRRFPYSEENSEMIVVGPVHVWSLCAHHLAPVEMNVWLGYLPDEFVLGLSKLARLAELLAKKPGLQEDVTSEIADSLFEGLQSKGSACLIRGRHLCMAMRGVKQEAVTTTTQLRGDFLKSEVRNEFLLSVRADIGKSSI